MKDDEAFARDRDELERVLNEEPRRGAARVIVAVVAGVILLAGIGVAIAMGVGGSRSADPAASPGAAAPTKALPSPGSSPPASAPPSTAPQSPTPGGEQSTDPDGRQTLPPADFDDAVAVEGGARVSVSSIEDVDGEAVVPGEVSGPAVRITVEVENDTEEAIDLTTAVVTVYAGESGLQANPVSKPAGKAFPSEVAPGNTAQGAFVFELPEDQRSGVRVEVDLSVSDPLIAFEGDIG